MSNLLFNNRKNIFDIIKEAEDDDNSETASSNEDSGNDNTEQNSDNSNNDSSDNNQNSSEDDVASKEDNQDYGKDEDFSIDTNLNDSDTSDDDNTSESSDNDSSSSATDNQDNAEPVQANTDIFGSLSAEEQQIKIKELKNMYADLYSYCNDVLLKINDIDTNEDNFSNVTRITVAISSLKQYIEEYLLYTFNTKSYIENDIMFNRYLTIMKSIAEILENMVKEKEKDDKK